MMSEHDLWSSIVSDVIFLSIMFFVFPRQAFKNFAFMLSFMLCECGSILEFPLVLKQICSSLYAFNCKVWAL